MTNRFDISIQFYATIEELRDLIRTILTDKRIRAYSVGQPPFHLSQVMTPNIDELIPGTAPQRIYFTLQDVRTPTTDPGAAASWWEFHERIENPLVLDVGHLSEAGQHESCLACRVDNEDTHTAWQRIARQLKKKLESGGIATNRQTGQSSYYRSIRFTKGAWRLQEDGVRMIATQGEKGPLIRLGNRTRENK